MDYRVLVGKLCGSDIATLKNLERKILKRDFQSMERWATFFAFDHPELVTDKIAKRIVRFYKMAISKNNSRAMLNLGALYYNGVFVQRDFSKAVKLYKIAAVGSDSNIAARAICNLGYCYYYGRSVAVDKSKAFSYYLKGVLLYNDPNCLYKLGDMYRYGECVEKDEKMAYTLYVKAHSVHLYFEEVFADILVRLGECELYGIGTRKDVTSALKRLTLAEGYLYEKIHIKKDPFAHQVLAKVKGLIQTAEGMLQGGYDGPNYTF